MLTTTTTTPALISVANTETLSTPSAPLKTFDPAPATPVAPATLSTPSAPLTPVTLSTPSAPLKTLSPVASLAPPKALPVAQKNDDEHAKLQRNYALVMKNAEVMFEMHKQFEEVTQKNLNDQCELTRHFQESLEAAQLRVSQLEKKVVSARQKVFLNCYQSKHVVYFGCVGDRNGKQLVKIGSTKDLRSTCKRHTRDYGAFELLHVVACELNMRFEQFLLHHPRVKKYKYSEPVKLNGKKSIEVICVSKAELRTVLEGVVRKYEHKYRNPLKDASDLSAQIEELTALVRDLKPTDGAIECESEDDVDDDESEDESSSCIAQNAEDGESESDGEDGENSEPEPPRCIECNIKLHSLSRSMFCASCVEWKP